MKMRILSAVLACLMALMLCTCALSETYTADDALRFIDEGNEPPTYMELSDDFSAYDALHDGTFDCPENSRVLVLKRLAPLKAFSSTDTPIDEDYIGDDLGAYCVYLDAEAMLRIPEDYRAHTLAEADVIIMIETVYSISGSISSISNAGSDEVPSLEELEYIMNGGDIEEETEEIAYNYRPLFDGYRLTTLYNTQTKSAYILEGSVTDYAEMRDNPQASDLHDRMLLFYELMLGNLSMDGTYTLYDLLDVFTPFDEDDVNALSSYADADDAEGFLLYCYTRYFKIAEELIDLDPEASEAYRYAIDNVSIPTVEYIANMRSYSGCSLSDEKIRDNLLYIGVPSEEDIVTMRNDMLDLMDMIGWDINLLLLFL